MYNPPIKLSTKDVKQIVNATFPDYRRHFVYVEARESVTMHDLNWGGGTRAQYRACTIDGRPLPNQYDMSAPAPWANRFEGMTVPVPVDCVIVEGGHFCGKVATLHINVNPANMPKFLAYKPE